MDREIEGRIWNYFDTEERYLDMMNVSVDIFAEMDAQIDIQLQRKNNGQTDKL